MKNKVTQPIVNPPYFSNWVDQWMPPLANKTVPYVSKVSWISPNIITATSFILYLTASVLLFVEIPYNHIISLILFPTSYLFDCLDGQLARTTKRFSPIGDYLDKTLDVLKIFIITSSLSLAVYFNNHNILFIFLGFIAGFFFCYRYYIKHEIMFTMYSKDHEYLEKSKEKIFSLYDLLTNKYNELSESFIGKFKVLWFKNRSIFYVDEGEFIFFTCVGLMFNHLDYTLYWLAFTQFVWGIYRLLQRGIQLKNNPQVFLEPVKR